eukprot:1813891-Amphidinium_carterae.1
MLEKLVLDEYPASWQGHVDPLLLPLPPFPPPHLSLSPVPGLRDDGLPSCKPFPTRSAAHCTFHADQNVYRKSQWYWYLCLVYGLSG